MSLAPPRAIHRPSILLASASAVVVVLLACACNRTIEEDEPRVLVDSRIEPCRERCTIQLDPECGARPDDHPFHTVEECTEDCAALEDNGWWWAPQEDGTDACAAEWIAAKDCIVALSCEDQHHFFTKIPAVDFDYPCKAESDAKRHCATTTPSIDKVETGP